jgi:hypothetical protein
MDLSEGNTHAFVVRLWREEKADVDKQALWRGHITHVASGEQKYFQKLDEIPVFIQTYLTLTEQQTK